MRETMKNGVYQSMDDKGEVMLTITALGNNTYRAVNKFFDITAEIIPLDEYRTQTRCIENKKADKNGRFRKSKTLAEHNTSWLCYMLEEKGFIRKSKAM